MPEQPDTARRLYQTESGGLLPVPDPTVLTTQQLTTALAALKEILFTRLDAMDKAIVLFNENLTRVPTDVDRQVEHLKELHETRFDAIEAAVVLRKHELSELQSNLKEQLTGQFASVQLQFKERDIRTDSSKAASDIALAAALQAQKEAVGEQNKASAAAIQKSELATAKQIDSLGASIQQVAKNVDEKFQDVKDRLTRIEGAGQGKVVAETTHNTTAQFVIMVIAVVISFVAVAVAILEAARKS